MVRWSFPFVDRLVVCLVDLDPIRYLRYQVRLAEHLPDARTLCSIDWPLGIRRFWILLPLYFRFVDLKTPTAA